MAKQDCHGNLEGRNLLEIVKYYCELIRQYCRLTEEMENIMTSAKTMAKAILDLEDVKTRKQKQARKHLFDECARTASYLLHKACEGFVDGKAGDVHSK